MLINVLVAPKLIVLAGLILGTTTTLLPSRTLAQRQGLSATNKPVDGNNKGPSKQIVRDLQKQLQRVGCYSGAIDGKWGRGSRAALQAFAGKVGARLSKLDPSERALSLVIDQSSSVCKNGIDLVLGKSIAITGWFSNPFAGFRKKTSFLLSVNSDGQEIRDSRETGDPGPTLFYTRDRKKCVDSSYEFRVGGKTVKRKRLRCGVFRVDNHILRIELQDDDKGSDGIHDVSLEVIRIRLQVGGKCKLLEDRTKFTRRSMKHTVFFRITGSCRIKG